MAEKEERILVLKATEDDFIYKHFNGKGFIPRQEATEKIAKADWIATVCAKNQCVPVDITKEQWDEEWEKLRIDYKKVYYAGAEAALNALLGETK